MVSRSKDDNLFGAPGGVHRCDGGYCRTEIFSNRFLSTREFDFCFPRLSEKCARAKRHRTRCSSFEPISFCFSAAPKEGMEFPSGADRLVPFRLWALFHLAVRWLECSERLSKRN